MDKNFYQSYFVLERDNWWFKARRNLVFLLLEKYVVKKEGARVFDYGCGSGFLVSELQKNGWDVGGADISEEAIAYGRTRGTKNLQVAKPDLIEASAENFNVIFVLDVLEHLENEVSTLKEIQRTLKPSGIAIITVPAFMFLWGVQDEVSHHYRRYRLPQLLEVIKNSGDFEVVQKTYFNTLLFLPIVAVRLLSKWLHIKSRESDFDINNKFLNRLLFRIFNLEWGILKLINFPFGVSILVVLRKNVQKIS